MKCECERAPRAATPVRTRFGPPQAKRCSCDAERTESALRQQKREQREPLKHVRERSVEQSETWTVVADASDGSRVWKYRQKRVAPLVAYNADSLY